MEVGDADMCGQLVVCELRSSASQEVLQVTGAMKGSFGPCEASRRQAGSMQGCCVAVRAAMQLPGACATGHLLHCNAQPSCTLPPPKCY
jgi:hypothetical protein